MGHVAPFVAPGRGIQHGASASERNRLIENAVTDIGRQAGLGDDIYVDPKALLQVVGQRDQVEQTATFRHIDQKVEITCRSTLFAARDRAEYADIVRPMGGGDTAHVLPNRREGARSMRLDPPSHRQIVSPYDQLAMASFTLYFESMAGTHLEDALRALRDTGSSDALYDHKLRSIEPKEIDWREVGVARDIAESWRITYSRRALLFAAFSAEAYANDFLFEEWSGGKDRKALQALSTVDKYALLPGFAGRESVLDRGRDPLQRIKWLFDRRNELVHAKPHSDKDLTWEPENHNPVAAAESILAVAEGAAVLAGEAPEASVLSYVLAERKALLRYGKRALPDIHDDPAPISLLSEVRRKAWN